MGTDGLQTYYLDISINDEIVIVHHSILGDGRLLNISLIGEDYVQRFQHPIDYGVSNIRTVQVSNGSFLIFTTDQTSQNNPINVYHWQPNDDFITLMTQILTPSGNFKMATLGGFNVWKEMMALS